MDYQQTCIQKQKHLTNIYFYQNLRQLYIMAPITTVRGPSTSRESKPPSYYFEGSRLGQIYHARLRTGCSSLNQHLVSKNIINSSLCVCGSVESTNHYLLNCTIYAQIRQEMLDSLSAFCDPTLRTLLYGDPSATTHQNKAIMLCVQEFIIKSGRFKIQ